MSDVFRFSRWHNARSDVTSETSAQADAADKTWPSHSDRPNELLNIWRGISVSTQTELNAAWPYLRDTPATVRLLSLEPLLEAMNLINDSKTVAAVDGVIVGCETGPNRRPCEIKWIANIVTQCKRASVPIFVKQIADKYGRVSTNMAKWPESIRHRELPG